MTSRSAVRALAALLLFLSLSACAAPTLSAPSPAAPSATLRSAEPTPEPQDGWTVSASTVGLAPLGLSCASLPVYTGSASVPAGTVISGKRVTTELDLSAGNITVENSCIQPKSVGRGMPVLATTNYNTFTIAPIKVTIRNNEVDGTLLDPETAALATGFIGIADLTGNYIHGLGSGIALMNTGNDLDSRIERNYVTGLLGWGNPATTGNHSDAFTIRDFDATKRPARQAIIRNNRFDCDSPNATGAFFIQTYSGRIDNVLIDGNLLEGDGYQLALEAKNYPYTNMKALNNRFSGTGFGATYRTGGTGWTQWSTNALYDPTTTDGTGRAVTAP